MEKIYGLLEPMLKWLPANNDFERGFNSAVILAALVFLLLIVLIVILKFIFRKPSVPGVTLERKDGDIFISRNAINNAVCRLEREFPALEIQKVVLQRRYRELDLTVTVVFDSRDEAFDSIAGAFKQRIFTMLNKSFGIDSIKTVSIVLAKIPVDYGDDEDDSTNSSVIDHNALISGV